MPRPIRPVVAALVLLLALAAGSASAQPAPQPAPRELLARAMAAAGGAERLARFPALVWHGRAVVHAGEREVRLQGTWKLEPPDVSIVETYEAERGPSSLRRMILTARGDGWGERGGQRQPLPADLVAHEREQFYLYYVMRLAPLQSPPFELSMLPAEAAGTAGLRVKAPGRPDVDLFFDAAGALTGLCTRIRKPGGTEEVLEELRFDGFVEGEGIRWPRAIHITWDGKPYFDLELTDFTPLPALSDPLLEAPPPAPAPAARPGRAGSPPSRREAG